MGTPGVPFFPSKGAELLKNLEATKKEKGPGSWAMMNTEEFPVFLSNGVELLKEIVCSKTTKAQEFWK